MALNVSFFQSLTNMTPDLRYGVSWDQLLGLLGPHRPYPRKDSPAMYSPAEWLPGMQPTRGDHGRSIAAVHFAVLDLDNEEPGQPKGKGKAESLDVLAEILGEIPVTWAFISSYSHANARWKGRLLMPFSRPALRSEWPELWQRMNECFVRGMADVVCKSPGHRYYLPAHPEAPEARPIRLQSDGPLVPIDVDRLLGDQVTRVRLRDDDPDEGQPTATGAGLALTREQLRKIGEQLARGKSKKELGLSMRSLVKGEEYAPKGTRHGVTFRLVCEVLDRYPLADPEALAAHWAPSLLVMRPTHVTHDVVIEMIRGKQQESRSEHTQRLQEAFMRERSTPYSQEEIARFAEEQEVPLVGLRHRWIIQHGFSFYVLFNGRYRSYSDKDVREATARDLAPAITAGIDLMQMTERGARPKTPGELVRDYGTVATHVVADLIAQQPYYDEKTTTMVEAPCPIRVAAKFDPEIDRWLTLLAGPRAQRLNHWLAAATRLDEPCAALYLEGAPGTGKTLLAQGVARIWSADRPTDLDEALATFNEALMRCPLVFGDEVAPVDHRGRLRTSELREIIQARQRPLKRKYKPNTTVRGCVRVVLAANNRNLLQTVEHLTEHDISAIVERFFYVPVQDAAREYLKSLPPATIKSWVSDDGIAKHCLWLSENIEIPHTGRFLVSGEASDLTRSLATSTGLRAGVCQWLVGFILNPAPVMNGTRKHLVRVRAGRLYVNSRALAEDWTAYVGTKGDPPTPTSIARALAGLSSETTLRDLIDVHRNVKFRCIDLTLLGEWAESTQYGDEALIRAKIAPMDEELVARARVN